MAKHLIALFCILTLTGSAAAAAEAGNAPYVSGGIGEEEQQTLQSQAADYNLRLSFAEKITGAYLSGTKVTIKNAAGATVLAASSEGPWFFVRLPAGRYQITAETDGQPQVRTVTLATGQATKLNFYWPGKNDQ